MNWKDHITLDAQVLAGKPVVKGTRISVELVMDLLGRGASAGDIVGQYPNLKPLDIQACLAYASEVLKSERVYVMPA